MSINKLVFTAVAVLYFNLFSLAQPQLWGTTSSGGSTMSGTIFTLDTAGNNYNLVYDWTNLNDGKRPHTGLTYASNDKFYGVTYQDGPFFGGVLFEYDYVTNTYTHKHDFQDPSGSLPIGPVIQTANGKLYGMSSFGGSTNFGVIYEYDITTDTYTSLLEFDNTILGSGPHGRFLEAPNGRLYGLTGHGGAFGYGTLIEYDISTNTCVTKIDLDSVSNGYHPEGSLILASDGMMYGMSNFGGVNNQGLIFRYDYVNNITTKLVDFNGTNGAYPKTDLMQASNGKLYGMTYEGGVYNAGVIFEYDIVNNTHTVLYSFDGGVNGSNPKGSFMESSNGKLYAYNSFGGAFNKGVVFEYDFVNDVVTKKLDFDGVNGIYNTQNFFVEICAKPTIAMYSSQDTICFGDSLLIYAEGTGSSYAWDNGATDSVWFNPSAGNQTFVVSSTNGCGTSTDSIQIQVNPAYLNTIYDSICSGMSYTFPDGSVQTNITSSLMDTSFYSSIIGCDSNIVVDLFVKPNYEIQDTNTVCNGTTYTFPDGTAQNVFNNLVYTSNLQTGLGCDSIIHTYVFISPTYNIKDTVSVCSGSDYTFPDGFVETNITTEVTHNSFLSTTFGCDSTVTITVTVDSLYNIDDFVQVCEGDDYIFPDGSIQTNITVPFSHTSNLQTLAGCDSIINTIISVNPIFYETENIDICFGDNYTFPDGTVFSSVINDTSYVSTISSGVSCDTSVTTNLFVHPVYSYTQYDTICKGDSYTFPDGFEITDIQGNLNHQNNLATTYGCDSIINTFIQVNSIDTSVQKIGFNLLISNASNVSYQWIDCETNQPIPGQTGPTFEPTTNGEYAVVLSDNYCNDTSACIVVEGLGLPNQIDFVFSAYPNPTQDEVNVSFSNTITDGILSVYDMSGKLISVQNINNQSTQVVNLKGLRNGVYVIELKTNLNSTFIKVIKN